MLQHFPDSPEAVFVNLLRSPGIDSQPGGINSSESISGSINVHKYGLRPQGRFTKLHAFWPRSKVWTQPWIKAAFILWKCMDYLPLRRSRRYTGWAEYRGWWTGTTYPIIEWAAGFQLKQYLFIFWGQISARICASKCSFADRLDGQCLLPLTQIIEN